MEVTTRYGLEDLLVVANTRHGPGGHHGARATGDEPEHDHLRDPRDARRFLATHDVEVPAGLPAASHLARLRAIREAVRSRVEGGPTGGPADTGGGYRLEDGRRLVAIRRGWDAVVDDLRLPLSELDEMAGNLKACGNPLCHFIFVDRSRNRSRRWCEMAACGNRAKVARHRHRSS